MTRHPLQPLPLTRLSCLSKIVRAPFVFVFLATVLTLSSCREEAGEKLSSPEFTEEEKNRLLKTGREVIEDLATTLGARLKKAIAEGGPIEAVKVCQLEAGPMTDATSGGREGVKVSRTSLKYRNPENAPDEMDRRILESWQQELAAGNPLPPLEVVSQNAQTAIVYKPIMLQPLCLNCHGPEDQLLPPLKAVLDDLYPEDKARGFQMGDLRGAFRVEIER
jgi:hypothetical protein